MVASKALMKDGKRVGEKVYLKVAEMDTMMAFHLVDAMDVYLAST